VRVNSRIFFSIFQPLYTNNAGIFATNALQQGKIKGNIMRSSVNISNGLTVLRVFIILPFVVLFYVDGPWVPVTLTVLFSIACISDYFDGYVARKYNQISKFGTFLDPVADKLLVVTAFLMLAGTGTIQGYSLIPAAIILCREILVSGLREFLSEVHVSIPVTNLAKWKTALQMISLGFLVGKDLWDSAMDMGIVLLWSTALLTLYTGYAYCRASLHHLTDE
jgi:cardiolipin synthase (CMP-forming)